MATWLLIRSVPQLSKAFDCDSKLGQLIMDNLKYSFANFESCMFHLVTFLFMNPFEEDFVLVI